MKYSLIAVLLITVVSSSLWPSNSKLPENATALSNINEPDMVTVQGGRFAMGGRENENEMPIHKVTLSSFKLAKYETTLTQWQQVMGSNPLGRTDCVDCPVTAIGWDDIQTFITKLNTLSGKTYRLPTEAEWEYAARGGIKSNGFDYAGSNDVNAVAWTFDNGGSIVHPVGQKQANELGLYDMSGNVFEWCNDWYDETYYANSPEHDPKGPATGPHRVFRGGNRTSEPAKSRVAYRNPFRLGYANLGFRLASSL
jgi:formylglycine-generating enzyme required for sulfatase activity